MTKEWRMTKPERLTFRPRGDERFVIWTSGFFRHWGFVMRHTVCGMQLRKRAAAASMEYEGRTYDFCVEDCHRRFAAIHRNT